ncbi:unnamed protein product [Cladocopium goreaui]|uniref:Zinc ribbon domain-containing protein n=1 Tax=Cladocopium goreaui TaxID=2562237 RepID=A0A9P1G1J3_9DINO|nr:unnamed protein product [Cladocopium goreaui]
MPHMLHVAAPLASELLATLEQEHTREIVTLYEEQVRLREELRRVVDLMQQEVLPRERQLHDMFEQLNAAFHSSAENMRRQQEEFHARASQVTQRHDDSRRQMLDPLQEAERELARINSILQQPLVISNDLPPQVLQHIQALPTSTWQPAKAAPRAASFSDNGHVPNCPNCGNEYAGDSLFCRKCGQKREGVDRPPSLALRR